MYHSTLGLRVIKNRKRVQEAVALAEFEDEPEVVGDLCL